MPAARIGRPRIRIPRIRIKKYRDWHTGTGTLGLVTIAHFRYGFQRVYPNMSGGLIEPL